MAMTACVGEIAHQLDLLVGERPDFLAMDGDCADQPVVLEHRDGEQRSNAAEVDSGDRMGHAATYDGIVSDVVDVDRPAWFRRRVQRIAGGRTIRSRCVLAQTRAARCASRSNAKASPSYRYIDAELGLANSRRVLQYCVEYRLQFARRAADDLEHSAVAVCCSSASASSRVRCCSSNSRTFSIAITAWSAKVVDQLDLLFGERAHRGRVSR